MSHQRPASRASSSTYTGGRSSTPCPSHSKSGDSLKTISPLSLVVNSQNSSFSFDVPSQLLWSPAPTAEETLVNPPTPWVHESSYPRLSPLGTEGAHRSRTPHPQQRAGPRDWPAPMPITAPRINTSVASSSPLTTYCMRCFPTIRSRSKLNTAHHRSAPVSGPASRARARSAAVRSRASPIIRTRLGERSVPGRARVHTGQHKRPLRYAASLPRLPTLVLGARRAPHAHRAHAVDAD